MGTPTDRLPTSIPPASINELLLSINLPPATSITPSKATAQYHAIYRITIPQNEITRHTNLILRVSGAHLPRIKTANEVGVMSWIRENTSIPIPDLVAYDETTDSPLGYEYTLLECVDGDTLSDVYPLLTESEREGILEQLIDFLTQLHGHEWSQIGGLSRNEQGEIVVSRIVDETFWQTADIDKFWPPDQTAATLNIAGPYSNYVDLITAQIKQYITLINIHPDLHFLHDKIPRLEAFLRAIMSKAAELDNVQLCLAHKDLHFANMLYSREAGKITAILDWEFAGVVPMPRWNPSQAFLWNGREEPGSQQEKQQLLNKFYRLCKIKGVPDLAKGTYGSSLQGSMQKVADYLRAVTEVVPRGQRAELVPKWIEEMEKNIACFGV